MKKLIFMMLFSLWSGYSLATGAYADKATQEVSELVSGYLKADDHNKLVIIEKIESIVKNNPDNGNVKNMYANILVADGQYLKGLKEIESINIKNKRPVSSLTECMLKEKLSMPYNQCYKEVVKLSEKEKTKDINYLAALYLGSDKRFPAEKERLLQQGKITTEEVEHFNLDRNKYINEIFP